jgi:Uma2 family endonuclease
MTKNAPLALGRSADETAELWPAQGLWRYEDYCRLPDDGWRYEVIRGRLLMAPAPKPRHQFSLGELHLAFRRFVDAGDLGAVLLAPIDVVLAKLATPVQPDLLFIRQERLDIVKENRIEGPPDLIVEVLSPSNWTTDRRDKHALYAEAGVAEYWIVDPEQRTIEVFVLEEGGYRLFDQKGPGETIRSHSLDGLEVAIDGIFRML